MATMRGRRCDATTDDVAGTTARRDEEMALYSGAELETLDAPLDDADCARRSMATTM
jgi:hypothetical protein